MNGAFLALVPTVADIRARVFNTGGLFFQGGGNPGYVETERAAATRALVVTR